MTASFSLSKKIKELESIEEYFQRPDMDLDEAIVRHKEALVIAKEILAYLEKAESTIKKIDISKVLSETSLESNDEE